MNTKFYQSRLESHQELRNEYLSRAVRVGSALAAGPSGAGNTRGPGTVNALFNHIAVALPLIVRARCIRNSRLGIGRTSEYRTRSDRLDSGRARVARYRTRSKERRATLEIVNSLVNYLPRDGYVAIVTGRATGQSIQDGVAEVQARSTLGVPGITGGGAVAAALAAVTDKELQVGLLSINGDDDLLATVLGWIGTQLGVVHSDDVIGVHLVEGKQGLGAAHDSTLVLVLEGSTAGIDLLDVVVVSTEALAAGNDRMGRGAQNKEQNGRNSGLEHHRLERKWIEME